MKILFFVESLRAGGKERRIVELIKGIRQQYKEVQIAIVLTKRDIHYKEIQRLDINIFIIERRFLKKDPTLFFRFLFLSLKWRPDIIHVWGNMVAIYSIPTKLILKCRLVNSQVTDAKPTRSKGILGHRLAFKFSDLVTANSIAGINAYDAPTDKSSVIYNGFDFVRIRNLMPTSAVRESFAVTTEYVIGMVASFSKRKDYSTYIKCAQQVLGKFNNVTFLCIGDGVEQLEKLPIIDHFRKRILFLGKQPHVENLMNICDVGVLLSNVNEHKEGVSNALMEFMALGKPVIATNTGGTIELIENAISGFLVDGSNAEQTSEKIEYLLSSDSIRVEMGKKSRERIEQHFSSRAMIESFYKLYIKALKRQ